MRLARLCAGTGVVAGVGYLASSGQQREDFYGAYRSIVNSSRAAVILYRAVKDYELSLMGLEYNSEEYHKARHEVHMRVAESILDLSKSNRGIYLKLGQYLGNLEKVVPWEFTQVLKVLQDSAPPVPYE
jgi:aarF domain-containing kinase